MTNPTNTLEGIPLRELTYSCVFDPVSMGAALLTFIEYLDTEGVRLARKTHDQKMFLRYLTVCSQQIQSAGLYGCASHLSAVLNEFLQQVGSNYRLKPFDGIGAVALYHMAATWHVQGTQDTIRYMEDGQHYKAFTIDDPEHTSVYRVAGECERYILAIETLSGHVLHFSELPKGNGAPASTMHLVNEVYQLHKANRTLTKKDAAGVTLPVIEFRSETYPDRLLGLRLEIPGQSPMSLTQVFQDTGYQLNETGARVKAPPVKLPLSATPCLFPRVAA